MEGVPTLGAHQSRHMMLPGPATPPPAAPTIHASLQSAPGSHIINITHRPGLIWHALAAHCNSLLPPPAAAPVGPALASDSCGCIMSHALGGLPYVEVDAALATFWVDPMNTPQFGSGVTAAGVWQLVMALHDA